MSSGHASRYLSLDAITILHNVYMDKNSVPPHQLSCSASSIVPSIKVVTDVKL